ncbi:DNA repair protein RAD50-like [Sitodiplosis mosellana]|uniref:DNA repair protein RAD50-like n=1 Tax=Sitodiplosis mosellana TaxID=263140 RepID=UPI002444F584|nr:DNA repair protein RAD50-like [Sitodiplosis mosellana]
MSTLDRLSIRGIRNFGVDAEDEQKVTFTTPLTLILGQNGSGKTTIIESIKYALTGDTPPNCKQGIGFINNPDILHISESLGQVKLRVKNVRGIETTICRSAKVIKKGQKWQYKSLDATITLNENGREVSTSKRNNDATEDMCTAIGVSKAIINNVLFCHQEDANWPLATDQEVMTRFDQIFGTTEYNNALDKMRNMRKKYDNEIKEKKVNLKEMEMKKLEADKKNMDINKYEDEMKAMKEKFEKCKTDLEPLREEYKKVAAIGERLSSITASKTKVETELKNEQQNADNCTAKIREIFMGSETELQQKVNSFKAQHLQKQTELSQNESMVKNAENELNRITKSYDEHNRKYYSLLQDSAREQDLYEEKAGYIKDLCTDLKINVDFDIKNDNKRAGELVANIRTALSEEQASVKKIADNNEKLDAEQEQELRGHREEEIRIKSEIASITKQLKDLEQTLDKQKEELKNAEKSGRLLASARQAIAKIQTALDEKTASSNTQGTRDEVGKHKEERQQWAGQLEEIDEQITYLSSMASVLANVETKEKLIEKRESEVRRIKNKHHASLQRLFPDEMIESNFKRRIESIGQKLQTEVNRLEAEIRLNENKTEKFKIQCQSKKQEQTTLEGELRKLEADIDNVCEQNPFDEVLAETKENVAKLQMEHSSSKSSELFYKKYIKKMEDQPCCPLCHKDMNNNEIDDLKIELNDQIIALPETIANAERELKKENAKLEKLLAMQSSVERVAELKSTLLPKIRDEIKKLDSDKSAAQEKAKQSEQSVKEPKEKKEIANKMVSDMTILDEAIRDVEQARIELEPLKRSLPTSDGPNDNNLDSLQKKRKELTDRIKALDKKIEVLEKRYQDDTKIITQLQERLMQMKTQELNFQGDIQKVDTLKARENELNEQIKELKDKKATGDQTLIPIEGKIRNVEEKRRRTKASGAETYSRATKRFDGLKKNFDSIERVTKEIEKLALLNLGKEIKRCEKLVEQANNEKTAQKAEIESLRDKSKLLTKELAEQQNAERDLNENLELKRYQKKIAEKKKDLETLLQQEQEVDFQSIIEKKAELARDMERITLDRTRMDGQMKEKQAVIDNLRAETNQPKYRDSVRNYKKAFYENVVLTKTVEDLTTYCETLERALTKFHGDKMEKINSLIRDLWRNIYKGNDIDFIQINTEEVKGTSKRRSYTYRVVASKNDTFMDFRGQSSAGQRVLACLIIRIALAETFSGHCGVLALDEPTTNLDKINIESLCEALNRIVEEREGQRNFMLIVITHDEDFINSLGRVVSYTTVSRDKNGKSRTKKLRNH